MINWTKSERVFIITRKSVDLKKANAYLLQDAGFWEWDFSYGMGACEVLRGYLYET